MRTRFRGAPRALCVLAVTGLLAWTSSASADIVVSDFSETFTPDTPGLTYGDYSIVKKGDEICVVFDLSGGLAVSAAASGANQSSLLISSASFKVDFGFEITNLKVHFYEDGGWGATQGGGVAAVGTVIVRPDNSFDNFIFSATNPSLVIDGGEWSTSAEVVVPVTASVFQIDFNNNLFAATGNAPILNTAFIDKKYVEICFEIPDDGGETPVPEPASLGVLGLGGLALLARRRSR